MARAALAEAAKLLPFASARLDAEVLLAHLLGISREELLLRHMEDQVDDTAYQALLTRRAQGEPVAYITGHRAFWTLDLIVTPDVLIPRPDSEVVVDALLAHLPDDRPLQLLDMGTGSGALLLALLSERPLATGMGVDMSLPALEVARANAVRCGLETRAHFVQSDWGAAVAGPFDAIISNPPYVESGAVLSPEVAAYEPASALYAGADGLEAYARIMPDLARLLAPTGTVAFEIGATQGQSLVKMAQEQGFCAKIHQDLESRDRCVILRRA